MEKFAPQSNIELSAGIVSSHGHGYGVRHFFAPKDGLLVDVVSEVLSLSRERVNELLWLGAIYREQERCSFTSPLAATAVDSRAHGAKNLTAAAAVKHATVVRANQAGLIVMRGELLRVHTTPRRFDVSALRNSQVMVFENADFVVINKPAGLPVHATVDNARENILAILSEQLRMELKITHRLDIATSGLMLYAKNLDFQKCFNEQLAAGRVNKIYQAVVSGDFAKSSFRAGDELVHYMEPSPRAPKNVSAVAEPGWLKCVLQILSVAPYARHTVCDDASALNINTTTSVLNIKLTTGRTHQIRAQLAHVGFPILGDTRYRGVSYPQGGSDSLANIHNVSSSAREEIALHCCTLEFLDKFKFYKAPIRHTLFQ